jgi:hypothetical protein
MGSKTTLLRALAAIGGVETATGGVRISVPNWRRTQSDANLSLPALQGDLAKMQGDAT